MIYSQNKHWLYLLCGDCFAKMQTIDDGIIYGVHTPTTDNALKELKTFRNF